MNSYSHAIVSYGFKHLTQNQIESCRKILSRACKSYKPRPIFESVVNYSLPITKKSLGARMGRGKGTLHNYVSKVVINSILFVFKKINPILVSIFLKRIEFKLPVKLKVVSLYKNGYCRYEDRCFR